MDNISQNFASMLAIAPLSSLADELRSLRDHKPLTSQGNGYYEGNILGFVKGLRISAELIYCIRGWLSERNFNVNWGHILDKNGQSCSPECDVIIHEPGYIKKWNGNNSPVMDFVFVKPESVKAVVSCKSVIMNIDKDYPNRLLKYGVEKVYLFGESCSHTNYKSLKKRACKLGYSSLCCAYYTGGDEQPFIRDENSHLEFMDAIKSL